MTAALWLTAILAIGSSPFEADDVKPIPPSAEVETCEEACRQLFGALSTRPAGPVKEPKRLQYAKPEYPDVPAGTVGSGVWVGEALIGPDGHVRKVSVLRDLKFTPPFPQFSKAISDSVLKWRYAPTMVGGRPVPVCMTVTVNIYWR